MTFFNLARRGNRDVLQAQYSVASQTETAALTSSSSSAAAAAGGRSVDTSSMIAQPTPSSASDQRYVQYHDDGSGIYRHPAPSPKFWNPVWLTTTTLCAFTATFTILTTTLVVLYTVSIKSDGLVSQTETYRLAWTYGPTAVFVLMTSMWMRVDYWCKVLTPFERMRQAPVPADQSILGDYLSPWNVVALLTSLRNRDFAVSLSVSGGLLLQLAVIVSTSLLTLESQQVNRTVDRPISRSIRLTSQNVALDTLGGLAADRYYGVISGRLPAPPTISSTIAIEDFYDNKTSHSNVSYTATVSGISANLKCEPLNLENRTYAVQQAALVGATPVFAIDVHTPNCTILGVPIGMGFDDSQRFNTTFNTVYQGWWGNFTCNDNVTNYKTPVFNGGATGAPPYRPVVPGFTDRRLLFFTSQLRWTSEAYDASGKYVRQIWVDDFAAIMCKSSYTVDEYSVEYSPNLQDPKEPFRATKQDKPAQMIGSLSDDELAVLVHNAVVRSNLTHKSTGSSFEANDDWYAIQDDQFYILMQALNGYNTIGALMNQSVLLDLAPKAFSGLLAHVFDRDFMTPADLHVLADTVVLEDRLVLKTLTAALAIVFLGSCVLVSVVLQFIRPVDTVPLNPQTISSKAKLMASSPSVSRLLQSVSSTGLVTMDAQLQRNLYYSQVDGHEFTIQCDKSRFDLNATNPQPLVSTADSRLTWWRPMTSRLRFIGPLCLFCTAMIVTLGILQHVSDSRAGLVDFPDLGTRHTLITILPAAVMSVTALMFASINFNVAVLAPFSALKKRSVPRNRGPDTALVGRPSIISLVLSIKQSQILPMFSIVAVMVGSFLTIVISGLYYTERVPRTTSEVLRQIDAFNYTHNTLGEEHDNYASAITKLIYFDDSTYPPGTYRDLVFPTWELTKGWANTSTEAQIFVEVPAIRPKLDCIEIPADDIYYRDISDGHLNSRHQGSAAVAAFVDWPCFENMDGTGSILNCSYLWSLGLSYAPGEQAIVNSSATIEMWADYRGQSSCLGFPPGNASTPFDRENQPHYPLYGCPSLSYTYGTVSSEITGNGTVSINEVDVTGFLCFQNIEEVQAKVALNLPDLSLNLTSPPQVIEDTAKTLNVSYDMYKESSPSALPGTPALAIPYTGPNYYNSLGSLSSVFGEPDNLFGPLIHGRPHLSQADLLNSDVLKGAMNDLYGTYMVQAISSNFRYNLSESIPSLTLAPTQTTSAFPEFTGLVYSPDRQRLKQRSGVTIALQVMLAVMVICALAVYVLSDRHAIVPFNPSSIAGTMILLAGSEMASRKLVPPGSEWKRKSTDHHRDNEALWDGYMFSLGWRGAQETARYGVDIDGAERSRWGLPRSENASVASAMSSTLLGHAYGDNPSRQDKAGSGVVYHDEVRAFNSIDRDDEYTYVNLNNEDSAAVHSAGGSYELSTLANTRSGLSIDLGDARHRHVVR